MDIIYQNSFLKLNPIGIQKNDYKLILCERKDIEPTIIKYHYSHTMPKNAEMCFKILYKDVFSGTISLGYGIRPEIKTTWGEIKKEEMREFDRMWLSDDCPKFSETIVISMLITYLKNYRKDIHYILSYADGTVGNRGIIYKASNFIELDPIDAEFYLLPDGRRVHPVTMWHWHKTRAKEFLDKEYPGIVHIKDGKQYRYIFILNKKKRKEYNKMMGIKND